MDDSRRGFFKKLFGFGAAIAASKVSLPETKVAPADLKTLDINYVNTNPIFFTSTTSGTCTQSYTTYYYPMGYTIK